MTAAGRGVALVAELHPWAKLLSVSLYLVYWMFWVAPG